MTMPTGVHTMDRCFGIEICPDVTAEEDTGPQMTWLPRIWPGTSSCVVIARPERNKMSGKPEDIAAFISATQYGYAPPEPEQQTSATTRSDPILLLEESSRLGNHRAFAAWVKAIDWSVRQPDDMTTAIDLALSLEMADLAIELAQLGGRLFPGHERVQRAAQVLAPPVVRAVHPPRARGLNASMAWFDEHASEYRGQWVAVRQGILMGVAESLEKLMCLIGDGEDAISTVVTRVL